MAKSTHSGYTANTESDGRLEAKTVERINDGLTYKRHLYDAITVSCSIADCFTEADAQGRCEPHCLG